MNSIGSPRHSEASRSSAPVAPEPAFLSHDPRFASVLGQAPRLECVIETDAHEGPVYAAAEDALYFTTLPRTLDAPAPGRPGWQSSAWRSTASASRLSPSACRCSARLLTPPTAWPSAVDGHLFVCEQGTRSDPGADQPSRSRPAAGAETVVDGLRGLALNSPNDIVVKSDGSCGSQIPATATCRGSSPSPQLGDYRLPL